LGEKNRELEEELGQADKWIETLTTEIMESPKAGRVGN